MIPQNSSLLTVLIFIFDILRDASIDEIEILLDYYLLEKSSDMRLRPAVVPACSCGFLLQETERLLDILRT